jgi:hypothetical protein
MGRLAVLVLLFVCLVAPSTWLIAEDAAPRLGSLPWEHRHYRVMLEISFDPAVKFSPEFRSRVIRATTERCGGWAGSAWHVSAREWSDLVPSSVFTMPEGGPTPGNPLSWRDVDKLMFVRITDNAGATSIHVREWDAYVMRWGQSASINSTSRRALPDEITQLLIRAFSPVAMVRRVAGREVSLRLRASALDRAVEGPIQPNDVFQPLQRRGGPDDPQVETRAVEWTLLRVKSVEGDAIQTSLFSGLRNPLANRTRGRNEQLALLVKSPFKQTSVRLETDGHRPLKGYELLERPTEEGKELVSVGFTGADGSVTVERSDAAVRMLFVKNGDRMLARLPLAVGHQRRVVAEIPDDDERLEIEGFIVGFQEDVIDTFARREMLISSIEQALERGERDNAATLLDRLKRLSTQYEMQGLLNQRRLQLTASAPRDPRIDKLFSDTDALIRRFLNPGPIEDLEAKLVSGSVVTTVGNTGGR